MGITNNTEHRSGNEFEKGTLTDINVAIDE
jgi:hypothetical protein